MLTEEKKWWNKLCKTLDSMPKSMEILVDAYGKISASRRGESMEYFNKHGDVDNVDILELEPWTGKGVENNGSSL